MTKYLTFGLILMLALASPAVAITLATAVGTRQPSGAIGEVLLEVLGQ